ncbi:MAG: hypothetical protein P8Y64_10905, partial [Gammaproteobacteria bacterium]
MRSVFGHLAAQGVDRYLKGSQTEALRDSFLDESIPLPENIQFYYWPFPYEDRIFFRDAAYLDIPTKQVSSIWLLKFFPISFMMAWEEKDTPMFTLPNLSTWRMPPPDQEVQIPIPLTGIPPRYWPEAPSDRSVILYGQEAMFSVPHLI